MIQYRRNLPHFQPDGGTFFVTTRLAGTLPQTAHLALKNQYKNQIRHLRRDFTLSELPVQLQSARKRLFANYEQILDAAQFGAVWLEEPAVAEAVIHELLTQNQVRYDLLTYVLMPNHTHLLFRHFEGLVAAPSNQHGKAKSYPLAETMRLVKGPSARKANQVLDRQGAFWQHESFDHWVRDEAELVRILRYLVQNPVKAGLVKHWREWQWTFVHGDLLDVVSDL